MMEPAGVTTLRRIGLLSKTSQEFQGLYLDRGPVTLFSAWARHSLLGGAEMSVSVRCPQCGQPVAGSDSLAGKVVRCPGCGELMRIRKTGGAQALRVTQAEPSEPSLWRNPAIYIALATIAALVTIFVVTVYCPPSTSFAPPAPPTGPVAAPSAPAAPARGLSDEEMWGKKSPAAPTRGLSDEEVGLQPKQAILKPLTPEALYAMASPAVVRLTALNYKSEEVGHGTGFFVRANGWLVTNYHVIADAKYVSLSTVTGTSARADLVLAWDEKADLAVLVVEGGTTTALKLFGETRIFPCLKLAPAAHMPAVGSRVWAIGNPQGLANSLSEGIVSGLRSDEGVTQVQCTAAVSPGSSGGPLLDCYGRVLGVMASMQTDAERLSQNLNFAVSSIAVRSLLARAATATAQPVGNLKRTFTAEETIAKTRSRLEKDPGNAWEWCFLGDWLNRVHRWTEARDTYQKALQLKPNNAEVYAIALFGLALAQWGLEDYAGVNESLKRAEAVEPDSAKYKVDLGYFYERTNRPKLAISVLQEAIRLAPRSTEARSGLIFVLSNMGKYADALLQCDELERLDPDQGRSERKSVLELMKLNEK